MANFFKRSETINNNFHDIYNELKSVDKQEIPKEIEEKYSRFGITFLDSLISDSILDIDYSTENPNILFIEKYSQNLINKFKRKNNLNKIIKSWQVWFVSIGSFGYFILELVKFVLHYCYNIK